MENQKDNNDNAANPNSNYGYTQKQKTRAGCITTIIAMFLGSLFLKGDVNSLGAIFIIIAVIAGILTMNIFGRVPTASESKAEKENKKRKFKSDIGNLSNLISNHESSDYDISSARIKRGVTSLNYYKKEQDKKGDFSPIYASKEDFQWIIDNSKNETLINDAISEIKRTVEVLALNFKLSGKFFVKLKSAQTIALYGKYAKPYLENLLTKKFSVSGWAHFSLAIIDDNWDKHLKTIIEVTKESVNQKDSELALKLLGEAGDKAKFAIPAIQKKIDESNVTIKNIAEKSLNKINK
jgi:hypothetical protein